MPEHFQCQTQPQDLRSIQHELERKYTAKADAHARDAAQLHYEQYLLISHDPCAAADFDTKLFFDEYFLREPGTEALDLSRISVDTLFKLTSLCEKHEVFQEYKEHSTLEMEATGVGRVFVVGKDEKEVEEMFEALEKRYGPAIKEKEEAERIANEKARMEIRRERKLRRQFHELISDDEEICDHRLMSEDDEDMDDEDEDEDEDQVDSEARKIGLQKHEDFLLEEGHKNKDGTYAPTEPPLDEGIECQGSYFVVCDKMASVWPDYVGPRGFSMMIRDDYTRTCRIKGSAPLGAEFDLGMYKDGVARFWREGENPKTDFSDAKGFSEKDYERRNVDDYYREEEEEEEQEEDEEPEDQDPAKDYNRHVAAGKAGTKKPVGGKVSSKKLYFIHRGRQACEGEIERFEDTKREVSYIEFTDDTFTRFEGIMYGMPGKMEISGYKVSRNCKGGAGGEKWHGLSEAQHSREESSRW